MRALYGILLILSLLGCKNTNPPEELAEIEVLKDGDGMIINFILHDKEGKPTTADGNLHIEVEGQGENNMAYSLGDADTTLLPQNFKKTKFGMGNNEFSQLGFTTGRLRYDRLKTHDDYVGKYPQTGKIFITVMDNRGKSISSSVSYNF